MKKIAAAKVASKWRSGKQTAKKHAYVLII
jgi:hypothetical protein